jgi:transposase
MPRKRATLEHTGNQPNDARRIGVVAMYEAGMSLRQIATRVGVSHQAVHGMLLRTGVAMRGKGGNQGSHSRHRR